MNKSTNPLFDLENVLSYKPYKHYVEIFIFINAWLPLLLQKSCSFGCTNFNLFIAGLHILDPLLTNQIDTVLLEKRQFLIMSIHFTEKRRMLSRISWIKFLKFKMCSIEFFIFSLCYASVLHICFLILTIYFTDELLRYVMLLHIH